MLTALVLIYSFDGKALNSALLIKSSVSHDPLEIILICWFAARETFLLVELMLIFLLKQWYFLKDSLMNRKFK